MKLSKILSIFLTVVMLIQICPAVHGVQASQSADGDFTVTSSDSMILIYSKWANNNINFSYSEGGSNNTLFVKEHGGVNYRRYSYVKFDISNAPENVGEAYLNLTATKSSASIDETLNVYPVTEEWDSASWAATYTYNPVVARLQPTYENSLAGRVTIPAGTVNQTFSINVSSYVASAKAAGKSEISFRLSMASANNQSGATFLSERSTVNGNGDAISEAEKPQLIVKKYVPVSYEIQNEFCSYTVDGTVKVTSKVINNIGEKAEFIVALMKKSDDVQVLAGVEKASVGEDAESVIQTTFHNLPDDFEKESYQVKTFVWNSVGGLKPLSISTVTSIGADYPYFDEVFLQSDPLASKLSDESFYGVWDESASTWTTAPKIDYTYTFVKDSSIGLSEVEAAVKSGDYNLAKEKYLEFAQKREAKTTRRVYAADKSDYEALKLQNQQAIVGMNGVFYSSRSGGMKVGDIVRVDNDYTKVSADLTSVVKTDAAGTGKALGLIFVALDKDGATAEFCTVEHSDMQSRPYLEVVENGLSKIIYPDMDTYIQYGTSNQVSHGQETGMYVSENVIGNVSPPWNENTKRSYLKFDLSGVSAENVDSASLHLTGRNQTGTGSKDVIVFRTNELSKFSEDMTWSSYGTQYIASFSRDSGPIWTSIGLSVSYREELGGLYTFLPALIGQFELTGNEMYAYHALRYIVDFCNKGMAGTLKNSALEGSIRDKVFSDAIAILLNSKYMTPKLHTALQKLIWLEGDKFHSFWDTQADVTNWGSMEATALYILWYYNQEMIPRTVAQMYPNGVTSPWKGDDTWVGSSMIRVGSIAKHSLLSDYTCTEYPIGYTNVTMSNVLGFYDIASIMNDDPHYPEDLKQAMIGLTLGNFYRSAPGFRDMQVGNAGYYTDTAPLTWAKRTNEAVGGDPCLDWIIAHTEGTTPPEGSIAPDFTSIVFANQKRAAMRSGWDIDDNYLHIDVQPSMYTHSHANDLSTVVVAYGKNLLVDPGSNNYNDNDPIRKWLNWTIGHNTIQVNNRSAKVKSTFNAIDIPRGGVAGKLDRWESNSQYDFFMGTTYNNDDDGVTYDVTHSRSVLFVKPGFYIVSDYLVPDDKTKENKYEQAWHMLPEANMTMDSETKVLKSNFGEDEANILVVPVDNGDFTPKGQSVKNSATVNGVVYDYSTDGTGIHNGFYSGTTAEFATYVKDKKTGDTTFNTVLYPTAPGSDVSVSVSNVEISNKKSDTSVSAFDVSFSENNISKVGTYYTVHDSEDKVQRTVGSYQTDASMTYVQKSSDGELEQVIIQDATNISDGETLLVESSESIREIAVSWKGDTLEIATTPINSLTDTANSIKGARGADLSKISIWAGKATKVTVNGEEVEFMLADGRFTFPGYEVPNPPVPPQEFTLTRAGALKGYEVPNATQSLEVEFDVAPNVSSTNIVFAMTNSGLDTTGTNPYPNFASILRMNPSGSIWDAYNTSAYASAGSLTYQKGSTYHVRMVADVASQTYNAYVSENGGDAVQIANNYGFRANAVAGLDRIFACLESTTGSLSDVSISNFTVKVDGNLYEEK